MGGRRCLRALLLLLLLCLALGSASGGPFSEAKDGKELKEGHTMNLVHPKVIRSAGGHRRRIKDCLGETPPCCVLSA
ncbi:apelin-like isoform 2-T2 [Vipera latastei]